MIAEYEPFTRPQDFFRETETQRNYIESIRTLGNSVFSPVEFINKYGLEIIDTPRFIEILLNRKPGLISQSGDEIGVRGKDVDDLIAVLEFQSQSLLEAGVFPPEYSFEINNLSKLLSEQ